MTERAADQSKNNEKASPLPLYIVDVNFDYSDIQRRKKPDYKIVMLFGFDPEEKGEPPLLSPFPFIKSSDYKHLNRALTKILTPEYYKKFGEGKKLRFPSFDNSARILDPNLRHEIGYSLLMLAEDEDHRGAGKPPRLKAALRNFANMFLMSAGVRWHMNSTEISGLEEIYREEFEKYWGKAPTEADESIRGTDLQLKFLKGRGDLEILISQDWPDIFRMGHGLTYMLMMNGKKAGETQIVGVGRGVPEGFGTPIGAGYLAMLIPKSANI